jgi:Rieske 2Fe-2S family protein
MLDIASHRGVASDVAGLIARRRPSFSLEAALYTSQDVFDLDVELIFGRQWIFAGPEAALPEPGDYAKLDFGRYSIITLRDDDGGVRAFHNVCRHRGARLLNECNGTVGNIVCPYHQWTYDTGGKLLDAEGDHAFDRAQYGLKPVHIHNVAGLLFVCLAKEAPTDFDKFAAEFEPSARHRRQQSRLPDGHRRKRQLETHDGKQSGVLPLRRASGVVGHGVRHVRLQ